MRISINIVNTSNWVQLEDCLASLEYELHPGAQYSVRVLDNASEDGSADLVEARFGWVSQVRAKSRRGFAANHNRLVEATDGEDWFLLLNDDTIVPPGSVRAIADALSTLRSEVGVVGFRVHLSDGTIQRTAGRFPTFWVELGRLWLGEQVMKRFLRKRWYGEWAMDNGRSVDWVSGVCLAIRSGTWRELGGLDPGYTVYYEDVDFCWRARKNGFGGEFLPLGDVKHFHGGTLRAELASQDFRRFELNVNSAVRYFTKRSRWKGPLFRVFLTSLFGASVVLFRGLCLLTSGSVEDRARYGLAKMKAGLAAARAG